MNAPLTLLVAAAATGVTEAVLVLAPATAERWREARGRWSSRRRDFRRFRDLPDFLELLSLALSCGHPLPSAWTVSVRHMPSGRFKNDLETASAALRHGVPASRCLSDLAARVGDPRAAMALALIAQALDLGNALEDALLGQAASLRRLRLTDVERRAQTAPLRMMLPVVGLILPAVMIVLLGPIVLRIMSGGLFS